MTPCVSRFLGISIYMYKGDHVPPHFHARYNGKEAMVEIKQLQVIVSDLPPKVLGLVIERATENQTHLHENWKLLEEEGVFRKIKPLV